MNNEIDLATLVKITLKYIASAIKKEDEWLSNAEDKWLSNAQNLLISTLDDLTCISWTAYHSPVQQASVNPASVVDISFWKSRIPSTTWIYWKKNTEFLNPSRTHNYMWLPHFLHNVNIFRGNGLTILVNITS